MAMSIDWEFFFPEVYFNHNRFETWSKEDLSNVLNEDGYWDPQKDFEFHLNKLKVDAKYFNEKNLGMFPKDFSKPLYSIETFEEARVKLLNRVKIIDGDGLIGYDDNGDYYETYKILLNECDKTVDVDEGTIGNKESKYHIREKKGIINSHRFNSINILYDWLLTLNPKGSFNNNWQIFAYGVTEYNQTMSYVDTFLISNQSNQSSLFATENINDNKIISQALKSGDFKFDKSAFSSQIHEDTKYFNEGKEVVEVKTVRDIRLILKDWNPFIS